MYLFHDVFLYLRVYLLKKHVEVCAVHNPLKLVTSISAKGTLNSLFSDVSVSLLID